jgi:membrane fusion protein, multidrug efflux system
VGKQWALPTCPKGSSERRGIPDLSWSEEMFLKEKDRNFSCYATLGSIVRLGREGKIQEIQVAAAVNREFFMSILRKPRFWLAFTLILVLSGFGIWKAGLIPSSVLSVAGAVDTATASTVEDDSDDNKNEEGEPETPPVPVELALVEGKGISAYYRSASVIEADRMVDLVCRKAGQIHSLNVEEGDLVSKGDVLAEVENKREKILLRKAELQLDDKLRDLERNRGMRDGDLISQLEFDNAESAWKLAEAERDLARITLEDTKIRAPFAGRITDRKIVLGQQVSINFAAFSLGDFTPLRVRVHLPETIARKVSSGQRVLVSPETTKSDLEAVVERVSPVVDPTTSTVRLTLLLDEGNEDIAVGGFVKVRITTDQHHDALAIPKIALVEEGALQSVFVAEADTVRKIEVVTGLHDESHVEVLEGLFEGDYVVVLGQGGLRTGAKIDPLNGESLKFPVPETKQVAVADR